MIPKLESDPNAIKFSDEGFYETTLLSLNKDKRCPFYEIYVYTADPMAHGTQTQSACVR